MWEFENLKMREIRESFAPSGKQDQLKAHYFIWLKLERK